LFPVQASKQSDLLAMGQKVLCTQKPTVNYFYSDNLIYYGN